MRVEGHQRGEGKENGALKAEVLKVAVENGMATRWQMGKGLKKPSVSVSQLSSRRLREAVQHIAHCILLLTLITSLCCYDRLSNPLAIRPAKHRCYKTKRTNKPIEVNHVLLSSSPSVSSLYRIRRPLLATSRSILSTTWFSTSFSIDSSRHT